MNRNGWVESVGQSDLYLAEVSLYQHVVVVPPVSTNQLYDHIHHLSSKNGHSRANSVEFHQIIHQWGVGGSDDRKVKHQEEGKPLKLLLPNIRAHTFKKNQQPPIRIKIVFNTQSSTSAVVGFASWTLLHVIVILGHRSVLINTTGRAKANAFVPSRH